MKKLLVILIILSVASLNFSASAATQETISVNWYKQHTAIENFWQNYVNHAGSQEFLGDASRQELVDFLKDLVLVYGVGRVKNGNFINREVYLMDYKQSIPDTFGLAVYDKGSFYVIKEYLGSNNIDLMNVMDGHYYNCGDDPIYCQVTVFSRNIFKREIKKISNLSDLPKTIKINQISFVRGGDNSVDRVDSLGKNKDDKVVKKINNKQTLMVHLRDNRGYYYMKDEAGMAYDYSIPKPKSITFTKAKAQSFDYEPAFGFGLSVLHSGMFFIANFAVTDYQVVGKLSDGRTVYQLKSGKMTKELKDVFSEYKQVETCGTSDPYPYITQEECLSEFETDVKNACAELSTCDDSSYSGIDRHICELFKEACGASTDKQQICLQIQEVSKQGASDSCYDDHYCYDARQDLLTTGKLCEYPMLSGEDRHLCDNWPLRAQERYKERCSDVSSGCEPGAYSECLKKNKEVKDGDRDYQEFVKERPIIFLKDPFGRYSKLIKGKFNRHLAEDTLVTGF